MHDPKGFWFAQIWGAALLFIWYLEIFTNWSARRYDGRNRWYARHWATKEDFVRSQRTTAWIFFAVVIVGYPAMMLLSIFGPLR